VGRHRPGGRRRRHRLLGRRRPEPARPGTRWPPRPAARPAAMAGVLPSQHRPAHRVAGRFVLPPGSRLDATGWKLISYPNKLALDCQRPALKLFPCRIDTTTFDTRPVVACDPQPGLRRRPGGPHRLRPCADPRRGGREDRRGAQRRGGSGRVAWCAALVEGMAARLVTAHWGAGDLRALASGRDGLGRPLPAQAWMALRRLGWSADTPDGVAVNDRIIRIAQEQAQSSRPGQPTPASGRQGNGTR